VDPTLEALWGQVVESWDDDGRHGAFLSYAQQTKQLGQAAGLYKSMISEDSPYRISANQLVDAQKRLAGVSMLAVMDLDNNKTDSTSSQAMWIVRLVGVTVVFCLFGALLWLLLH
jgi:hypothetical protein